jgi:hypothetical protein
MKIVLVLLVVLLPLCGCTTKSSAKAQSRAAFAQGQQQAFAQIHEEQRTSIRVIGPVRNPEIAWTDGLTLAQVIASADYTDPRDPKAIFVIRRSERFYFDPKTLLRGRDMPLEPGDTVELQP